MEKSVLASSRIHVRLVIGKVLGLWTRGFEFYWNRHWNLIGQLISFQN